MSKPTRIVPRVLIQFGIGAYSDNVTHINQMTSDVELGNLDKIWVIGNDDRGVASLRNLVQSFEVSLDVAQSDTLLQAKLEEEIKLFRKRVETASINWFDTANTAFQTMLDRTSQSDDHPDPFSDAEINAYSNYLSQLSIPDVQALDDQVDYVESLLQKKYLVDSTIESIEPPESGILWIDRHASPIRNYTSLTSMNSFIRVTLVPSTNGAVGLIETEGTGDEQVSVKQSDTLLVQVNVELDSGETIPVQNVGRLVRGSEYNGRDLILGVNIDNLDEVMIYDTVLGNLISNKIYYCRRGGTDD